MMLHPCNFTTFPVRSSQVLIDEADKADAAFLGILLEVIEVGRQSVDSEMQRVFVSEFSISKHFQTIHLESSSLMYLG